MKKLLPQLALLIGSFLVIWFLLSKIDWIKILKLEEKSDRMEEKLGELLWSTIESQQIIIKDTSAINPIELIKERLCESNQINPSTINIHLIKSDEINAFAMPGNHIIINTGLINEAGSVPELAGVIAHELAHIQKGHVIQKLIREVGLTILLSAAGGKAGGQVALQILKHLSSSAYDRNMEREADRWAITYLSNAGINPKALANFFERLENNKSAIEIPYWISSHPELEDRIRDVKREAELKTFVAKPLLSKEDWENLKKICKPSEVGGLTE
jgi:predicted Zn-dependent protease